MIEDNLTLVNVTQYTLRKLKLKISEDTIQELLLKHPDYPNIISLSDALNKQRIENKVVRINSSQILELEPNFFAHLVGHGLVFVIELKNQRIKYFACNHGIVEEEFNVFNTKWNGIVLLLDYSKAIEEENFRQNKAIKLFKNIRLQLGAINTSALLLVFIFINGVSIPSLMFLTKLIGLTLCMVLAALVIKKNNFASRYCQIGKNFNCNDVLTSPGSKFLGFISFSDIGMIYFGSGAITILFALICSQINSFLSLLILLSFSSIPYILYSIFYQSVLLKKWCILCLSIIATLCVEVVLSIIYILNHDLVNFSLFEVSIFILWICLSILSWSYLKEILNKGESLDRYKYPFYRISNNKIVFAALHQNSVKISMPPESNYLITIGNLNSEHNILMVLNPFCPRCAKEFNTVIRIYNDNSMKLSVNLVFSREPSNTGSLSNEVCAFLIELSLELDDVQFGNALSDWFIKNDLQYLNG